MNLSELLNNELIIPEIQRDYVWGNNEIVLRRFLKIYLIILLMIKKINWI